ncbi:hypothetical protein [Mariniblastus fucicola]|nr:hypothetical protein [Mariniblastus fucicola]
MFETYKPSGGFGLMVLPALLVGMIVAVAISFLYQLLLNLIPFIYINVLLTVGAGFLLSIIGISICSWGHCRNRMLGFLVGLMLAVSFLGAKFWFQYQASIPEIRQAVVQELLASKDFQVTQEDAEKAADSFVKTEYSFLEYIQMRVDQGWNIGRRGGGGPVAGWFVYLVWLIEAGIIAFMAITGALSQTATPYSEKLSAWANEEEIVMSLPISDAEMVAQINQATTVDQLLEIPIPKTDQSNIFAIYKTNSIQGQELEDAYLTVELLELSVNSKGEQEKTETPLVTHAILSSEKRKELVENASLLQEALADYRQAVDDGSLENDSAEGELSDEESSEQA